MRKYLQAIGVEPTSERASFLSEAELKKQQEQFGFDDREVASVDITALQLVYERVERFIEIAPEHNINLKATKVEMNRNHYSLDVLLSKMQAIGKKFLQQDPAERDFDLSAKYWSFWRIVHTYIYL